MDSQTMWIIVVFIILIVVLVLVVLFMTGIIGGDSELSNLPSTLIEKWKAFKLG